MKVAADLQLYGAVMQKWSRSDHAMQNRPSLCDQDHVLGAYLVWFVTGVRSARTGAVLDLIDPKLVSE